MAAAAESSQGHARETSTYENLHRRDDSTTREPVAFPSLTPLSHDLELLSPVHTANFSVEDFLLSRTKASDLNFILSDLRSYSEKLKDELYSIINEDYKDFVSLGSSLKAEAHRIARLGWTFSARSLDDEEEQDGPPPQGLMAPVRDTLLASRSMLKSVQDDIADCIRRKEDATSHKARLELMLQLHDSTVRLEDLLLIQHEKGKGGGRRRSCHAARRPSMMSMGSVGERRDSLVSVASGSDQELSDYAMSSEYEEASDSDEEVSSSDEALMSHANGDVVQPRRPRRKIIRRLSSAAHQHITTDRTSLSPNRTRTRSDTLTGPSASASSSSLLGLPQRIARTSAEYSRLRFLHRRIDEENLTHFADALADRIDSIRSVLRQDLRTLLRALLTSSHSLLLYGRSSARLPSSPELRRSRPNASGARRPSFLQSLSAKPTPSATGVDGTIDELDAWSQIAEPVVEEREKAVEAAYWEARLDEQRSWLEMALTTLNTLTLVTRGEHEDTGVKRRNEAEEAVRDLLVSNWSTKHIVDNPAAHDNTSSGASWSKLPEALQSQLQEHRTHVQSLLLPSPTSATSTQLVDVYNSILTFAASTAWHVTDASREIQASASSAETDPSSSAPTGKESHCDIFTNVVWDELSTHLLSTLGNVVFFVGQADTFYTNFNLTNTFLQRFLSLAPTEEARAAVQDHPNWLAFKRRWQLPVYFQMRFREVITTLEAALTDGRTKVDEEGGEMKATQATLAAIARLWSDGVHIHELSARKWRVTLQILSRYKSWIEEQSPAELGGVASNRNLDALRSAAGAGSGEGSGRSSIDQHQQQQRSGSMEISRVGTPQPPPDLSSQQHEDEQLQLATELLADSLILQERMDKMLDEVILPRISTNISADSDALTSLREDLASVLREESMDFISPGLVSAVGRFAYNIITPRSAAPLRLLRSFSTPSYRPSSTTPGGGSGAASVQVIHQLFSPLETFLSLPSMQYIPQETRRGWAERILNDAFKRYTNTIETISKNQQSLIRLKKSQTSLLGGLFKSANDPKAGDAEKSMLETNKQALSTFEHKIKGLQLNIDLDKWDTWIALKNFLESEIDTM